MSEWVGEWVDGVTSKIPAPESNSPFAERSKSSVIPVSAPSSDGITELTELQESLKPLFMLPSMPSCVGMVDDKAFELRLNNSSKLIRLPNWLGIPEDSLFRSS